MRLSQKITALFLAVGIMLGMCTHVSAATTIDDVIFDMTTLGIMEGDENGDLLLDNELTRAEFACMVVRFMSMRQSADSYSGQQSFSDVPPTHWAFGSIEVLKSMNLIDGTDYGKFSPDDRLTGPQAVKILVGALGYSIYAENLGGYPAGYMSEASQLGLLERVEMSGDKFTRANTAWLIYNALDIDIVSVDYSGSKLEYNRIDGDTYRSRFEGNYGALVKYTGMVTATANAYLYSARSGMKSNEIEIDGKLYECDDPKIISYIGKTVDFYLDEEDSRRIINIKLNNENSSVSFDLDNFDRLTDSKIYYYVNETDSKTKSYSLSSSVALLVNNRVEPLSEQPFGEDARGTVELIDNNDDDEIDIIIVRSYTSMLVENVNANDAMIYLNDKFSLCGKKYVSLDEDDTSDIRITLKYADGTDAQVSELEQNDVISAFVSGDETMIELIVTRNTVNGTLDRTDEETALIGGEEYELESSNALQMVSIKDEITAYLNFNGEVVYARVDDDSNNYAYILRIYETESGEDYEAKLLLPAKLTEIKEEVEDEDGGEATIKSKLVCRNEEVITVPLAGFVTVDGEQRLQTANQIFTLEGMIVEYTLNSAGELARVKTPEQIGTGKEKYYNSSERTFGKTSGGAFGISLDTKTICVPKDVLQPSTDDCLVYVDMNNGQLYDVKGYDKNEDSKTAELIVVTIAMKSGSTGLVTTTSDVAMVQTYSETVDEEGEIKHIAELLTDDGVNVTYELTDAFVDSADFSDLSKGDLISYSLDNEYKIDMIRILGRMSERLSFGVRNLRKDYETFAGYASDITFDDVSEELNRWVNTVSCVDEQDGTDVVRTYEVLKNSGPPIFIYNPRTKTSEAGTIRDIAIGTDQIFVSAANNKVRAIVVIKN